MAEKYTLNWQTFSEHLKLMFKDLYQEGRFSDVTLVYLDKIVCFLFWFSPHYVKNVTF